MPSSSPRKMPMGKKIGLVAAVIIGGFFILAGIHFCWLRYGNWRATQEYLQAEQEAERPYREDRYGGQTPKETLELFIAAVEKNDFELASKYFVLSKQEEWKAGLQKAKEKNTLAWLLNELKNNNRKLKYFDPTPELNGRSMYTIGGTVSVTFIKYPSGVWKIEEI